MASAEWLKIMVGMFEGHSFKRIKRAKIDGISDFRDKLTAVWFELLDLGGKVNNLGYLENDEVIYRDYEDIAIALDRTTKEIELCMKFYIENRMIEINNGAILIANWYKYQNFEGMEKVREQGRIRQQRFREKQKQLFIENNDVTLRKRYVTESNAPREENKKEELELEKEIEREETFKLSHAKTLFSRLKLTSDAKKFYHYYAARGWKFPNGNPIVDIESLAKTWDMREQQWNDHSKKQLEDETFTEELGEVLGG